MWVLVLILLGNPNTYMFAANPTTDAIYIFPSKEDCEQVKDMVEKPKAPHKAVCFDLDKSPPSLLVVPDKKGDV